MMDFILSLDPKDKSGKDGTTGQGAKSGKDDQGEKTAGGDGEIP